MRRQVVHTPKVREPMDMNAVFSQYFPIDPTARTTFQCAALVGGARVEIEAIATR
jgi:enamine deaminase RidA (YjgF/YER057c/UK114 family)